jgi:peroxiredoxin
VLQSFKAFACLALLVAAGAVEIGYKIPEDIELHKGFPPEKVNLAKYIAGRNVILVGLPGAFTPT